MNWGDLPFKLKVYVVTVACLAFPIVLWAGWFLATHPYNGWLILALLAIATVPFFLFLPSFSATITIGDAYIMAIAMMYGVAPCIMATFLCIVSISVFAQRPKIHIYRVVFNTANTTCCAFLYSSIYRLMNHGNSTQLQDVLLPAVAVVVTYFLSNSLLTSIAIAWSNGESILKFWVKSCLPLANDYSISAVSAIIIVALNSFDIWWIPLAVAPLIGLAWGWNQVNKTRVMEAVKHLEEQEQLYMRTVESLALAVDAKDQTTYGHIRRVKIYATRMAELCNIKDQNELKAIKTAALLHDIGKLAIDDYILNKPGRLSKEEFEKIKVHAAAGDEILQHVHFPYPAAKYVRHHHERWDGNGYPDGLKGEEIPLASRILAVADAFDAIRFSRPYKLAIQTEEARELLLAQSGIFYDPEVLKLFADHIEEIEQAAVKEAETSPEPSFRKYFETVNQALSAADVSASVPSNTMDMPAELILLAEFCSTIAGHLDLKDLLPIFASRMKKIVPFDTCAFYLLDGNDSLRAVYAGGIFAENIQDHIMSVGKGISGWVYAHGRPMINTGPALDFHDIEGDFSIFKDTLVVPIIRDHESLGTISLYTQAPSTYTRNELEILQALAGFLAPIISDSKKQEVPASEKILDPTTRMHRMSYLTAVSPQLISLAEINRSPASLIFFEISNLNQITRLYGTEIGHAAIKKIADDIKLELRETDIVVRFGHQSFVAFLPGLRDEQALHCAQRLRQQIQGHASTIGGQNYSIDCQIGMASYPRDGINIFALLRSAQKSVEARAEETASPDGNVVEFPPRS
jgi:diguanylate cyclase (GGDEF)-like protein/putative nucleotidyltransferase with HDIG domain